MFPSSTQLKYWTYSGSKEISRLRCEANQKFIEEYKNNSEVGRFLNPEEETVIRRHYEEELKKFCLRFQPPMPKYVMGAALIYYKRLYVHRSVMDYHPKDMVYICAYLACKVEEFNLSIDQFVHNVPSWPKKKAKELIVAQELELLQLLHYHLTIHNPYRPAEGLLIDIKTRYNGIQRAEDLRKSMEFFIDESYFSDVPLIYSPAQVALAALVYSAQRKGLDIESYLSDCLSLTSKQDDVQQLDSVLDNIISTVMQNEAIDIKQLSRIKEKLTMCRNSANDPDSELFQKNLKELREKEKHRRSRKQARIQEEEMSEDKELLGL